MTRFSRIKKETRSIDKIETDFPHDDARLARRWKRRGFHDSVKVKVTKDVVVNNLCESDSDVEIITIDSDYESYLNSIGKFAVDNGEHNKNCDGPVTLKTSDDGGIPDPLAVKASDDGGIPDPLAIRSDDCGIVDPLVVRSDDGGILDPLAVRRSDDGGILDPLAVRRIDDGGIAVKRIDDNGIPDPLADRRIDDGGIQDPLAVRSDDGGVPDPHAVRSDDGGDLDPHIVKKTSDDDSITDPLAVKTSDDGDDIPDSQYALFLENLKENGDSYVLTYPIENNVPLVVNYEKEDDNASRRGHKKARKQLRNNLSSNGLMVSGKVPEAEKEEELEAHNVFHCPSNDSFSNMVDDTYQEFLNALEFDGQSFIYVLGGGEKLVYEKEETDSESEVEILEADPFADEEYNPFVSSKAFLSIDVEDYGCVGSLVKNKEAQYRKKLMETLRKPYDQREYEELMRKARERIPLERPLPLRGVEKMVKTGSTGKSYFDKHKDLARAIHEVGDKPKILNILRGFFFWLQNVSFEGGAFKPWLDADCLNVLPEE